MRIHVDRARCEGHDLCAAAAPEVSAVALHAELPAELERSAKTAAHVCPVAALRVTA